MKTAWFSLRRRLLSLLLGGVAATWRTMVFSYVDAHHEVDELFDAQLAQAAKPCSPWPTTATMTSTTSATWRTNTSACASQIWQADGTLLLHSKNSPLSPLTAIDGFSETQDADGHWRHFSQWNRQGLDLQVQVSENHYIPATT